MSTEENKALYRRWFEEVVSGGNLELADHLLAPGYVLHFPGFPGPVDSEGHKQLVMMFRNAFPDWHESVDDVIAEGDRVVIRVTGRGTHQGELMGIPPTGERVTITGITVDRLSGGKIEEEWNIFDQLGMLRQLGVAPG